MASRLDPVYASGDVPPLRPAPVDDGALARAVGLLLSFLMVAAVLYEQRQPAWHWAGPVLHALLGTAVGAWLTRHAADPKTVARGLVRVDHFFAGAWTALIGFNLLPTVLLLCILSVSSGGWRLTLRSLLGYVVGVAAGVLVYGARLQLESGLLTVLACLPVLLAQPFVLSRTSRLAIQRLQHKRDDLERLNQHDGLSGLYNRLHWESVLRAEFAHFRRIGQPAALVMADLDHFKQINDKYGHAAGDEVIRRFAQSLRRKLRASDTPGRYGGEEFCILLPRTTPEEAREVVERLRLDLHERPLLDSQLVTASFGVAPLTSDIDTYAAWLRLADQMLYRAKHERDRVVMVGDAHAGDAALAPSNPSRPSSNVLAALRDPAVLPHLLSGLDMSEAPLALFDRDDRMVLTNLAFQNLYRIPPGEHSFDEIIRQCFEDKVGPRIETHDIDAWLRMAASKRRVKPRRSFAIDMVDGRWFWAIETVFSDGWLLLTMNNITESVEHAAGAADLAAAAELGRLRRAHDSGFGHDRRH